MRRPAEVLDAGLQALQRADGAVEALEAEVERRAVVGLKHKDANGARGILVEHLLERVEVAQALGHLLALHAQHARVHPGPGELIVPSAPGLGGLVLVVREDEVLAAAVDVDRGAQVVVDHRAAFGVPARAAVAPGRGPGGLAGFGGFPEGEVERVALVGVLLHTGAHAQLVHVAAREHAVAVVGAHGEIDIARVDHIGMALVDQDLDHLLHGVDLAGGARADVRVEHAQAVHLLDEGLRELVGHLGGGAALLVGAVDDLVVHIGQVLGEGDLVALIGEVAADHVEGQEGAAVADMDLVVDRGAAHIHADLARLDGHELFLAMVLGVVDQHDSSSCRSCTEGF